MRCGASTRSSTVLPRRRRYSLVNEHLTAVSLEGHELNVFHHRKGCRQGQGRWEELVSLPLRRPGEVALVVLVPHLRQGPYLKVRRLVPGE